MIGARQSYRRAESPDACLIPGDPAAAGLFDDTPGSTQIMMIKLLWPSPQAWNPSAVLAVWCLVLYLCTCRYGFAAEIDSVTPRKLHLDDSIIPLNEMINRRMEEGIIAANRRYSFIEGLFAEEFCDEDILYTELRKAIFQTITASLGFKGYGLDKQLREGLVGLSHSVPLHDSIYSDIHYLEGFFLNLKELSDVINIDGHLIGLDKMGHFFAEGWQYFERSQYDPESLDLALRWGKEREEGIFGYSTTGIFSYADLVANFNGWRFWNRILQRKNDPLKGIIGNLLQRPYVECKVQLLDSIMEMKVIKSWESNYHFDINDYIDGAWDEGNNCNNYRDPLIAEKVTARIHAIAPDFSCPYDVKYCLDSRKKYGPYAEDLLHPRCLNPSSH